MAQNRTPGFEKETDLVEKFQNRGYWGYHEGEERDAEDNYVPGAAGCGAGG